ncbi:MAG: hypothetical protein ACOC7U_05050 [Spirochaetota bacterium]
MYHVSDALYSKSISKEDIYGTGVAGPSAEKIHQHSQHENERQKYTVPAPAGEQDLGRHIDVKA